MTLHPNSTLQGVKYKIEKVLGQGGFGITYLAEQTMLERKVAIKEFFMKEFCERDESTSHVTLGTAGSHATVERFREKFLKEARNIAKLKHPHIIQILDVFEENGTAYYVMEYAENGSLSTLVADNKPLPEAQATRYILQVADALSYIHQRKMNHLDIKPSNIMLNGEDETLLIDFGLSKQYDEVGQQTSTTPVGLSEGYAPMEQYKQGGVKEFSPETDIYALGATFFKLLTGKTPPGASDVNEDGLPIEELESNGVSQAAIDAITKAMEPRRKMRIHDVKEFANLLSATNPQSDSEEEESIDDEFDEDDESVDAEEIETEETVFNEESHSEDINLDYQEALDLYEKEDYNHAAEYFQKLASRGHVESQFYLGLCYENGEGVQKDLQKAFSWYEKAAQQGDSDAQFNLGWCYESGEGVQKELQKAIYWYKKSANQGNALAQNKLGLCYENGVGVQKDQQKAVYWYKKSASQGNAFAEYNLGDCYEVGEGVQKDLHIAFSWYEKAAKQGNADAQNKLGYCYENGEGVQKDLQKAIYWYKKGASQGNAFAQYNLGVCYEDGKGVQKDLQEAVSWYEKAAQQGDPDAQNNLGLCYEEGKGVQKDLQKAFYWYKKGASQGNAVAQFNLAVCYEEGKGVLKDKQKATYWYKRSANQGYAEAQKQLDNINIESSDLSGGEQMSLWLALIGVVLLIIYLCRLVLL